MDVVVGIGALTGEPCGPEPDDPEDSKDPEPDVCCPPGKSKP